MQYQWTIPQTKLLLLKKLTRKSWLIRSIDESNLKVLTLLFMAEEYGPKNKPGRIS